MKLLTKIVLAVVTVIFLHGMARAQEQVKYTWTAPTSGSAAVSYVVEASEDGGAFVVIATNVTQREYTMTQEYGKSYQIRVAGVDGQGRQGPYSVASDPYTPDAGPPGAPGKPTIIQIIAGLALLLLGLILGRVRK